MTDRPPSRLAAILALDVAGYSRLMEANEAATLVRLKEHRAGFWSPEIARHGGRVVGSAGDGLLAEFPSAVAAVDCALSMQRGMERREAGLPEERRMRLRIGINVGEIVPDGSEVYGDSVNVAARLEGLAPPGGIALSDKVHREVFGKVAAAFEDVGQQRLKNISEPVHVWQWRRSDADRPTGPVLMHEKPSVVVLPFVNMSGDQDQEYFADGITEDITTGLSRIRSLFVIARNSAFTYKGRQVDVRQIGRELGVRYVLEGSVRKAGGRLRITAQLIEAGSGVHLWAEKFDSAIEDVFELQDEVTAQVAGAIEPSINLAEIRRAAAKPTSSLQAYDYFLRSLGEAHLFTREGMEEAIRLARQAIAMDPRYAHPRAYIASWLSRRRIYGWMEDEAAETAEGVRLAYQAVQIEPDEPAVLTEAAFAIGHLARDLATALSWFDRAIALNPNSAFAFGRGAIVRNFSGDYVTAAEHAERAIRQSPFDPFRFSFSLAKGNSHLLRQDLPQAVTWLQRAAQENPRHSPTFLMLTSALAHSGMMEEARSTLRRLQELNSMSSASWHRGWSPYPVPAFEYVLSGARMAGLPE